jgi:hypothetical protein
VHTPKVSVEAKSWNSSPRFRGGTSKADAATTAAPTHSTTATQTSTASACSNSASASVAPTTTTLGLAFPLSRWKRGLFCSPPMKPSPCQQPNTGPSEAATGQPKRRNVGILATRRHHHQPNTQDRTYQVHQPRSLPTQGTTRCSRAQTNPPPAQLEGTRTCRCRLLPRHTHARTHTHTYAASRLD